MRREDFIFHNCAPRWMGMLGPKKEDLPKLLPADQMESALEMMADVWYGT